MPVQLLARRLQLAHHHVALLLVNFVYAASFMDIDYTGYLDGGHIRDNNYYFLGGDYNETTQIYTQTLFKTDLTASRTRQLCDAMTVTKDLMANLLLAAGGRSGISTGGGGSNDELTNWDGRKKKTGWGM